MRRTTTTLSRRTRSAATVRAWAIVPLTVACVLVAGGCSGSGDPPAPPGPTAAPATSAATPAPTTPTRTPARDGGFTLVATGDVLLHPQLWAQAERDGGGAARMDFRPMLAGVRPYVSGADLALCHLETPLAGRSGPYRGYPSFSGPPQIAPALRQTGYDACSTASNHTLDQGAAGIDRTLDALDAAGIAHAGSARTRRESERSTFVDAAGVKVALISYAYGFNGKDYPDGQRWRANVIDPGRIRADARRARQAGAQVVIVAMHWGTEYSQTPSAQQRDLAPELARTGGVDLIISHHAHVVEPIQKIGRTWVVYGLGNLLAWHSTPGPANAEGLLVRFTFTPSAGGDYRVTRAEYLPLLVARDAPIRLLAVPRALATRRYGSSNRLRLQAAEDRTSRVVDSLGARRAGLREITWPP